MDSRYFITSKHASLINLRLLRYQCTSQLDIYKFEEVAI